MEDDIVEHPTHGLLGLKRSSTNQTGYVDVNKKELSGGRVGYYAKTRFDLNQKKQSKVGGSFNDARECAINLAVYLKENPPIPLDVAGRKVGWLRVAVSSSCSHLARPGSRNTGVPMPARAARESDDNKRCTPTARRYAWGVT